MQEEKSLKRSQYWETLLDFLDTLFPKGESKERGQALMLIAYIDLMLQGKEFDKEGNLIEKV